MDIITLDFESYYSKEIGFSKLTTEEYVRHPEFEIIGVSVKVNNGGTEWASGTHEQLRQYLLTFDWENSALLAHNCAFDGAILNWILGIQPKVYLDTLSMARAVHGIEAGGSLKALAERYKLGEKGTEVVNALGKRRNDFTDEELARYGDYCINDTELTYALFGRLSKGFPKNELRLIDLTLRMFIEPVIELDTQLLTDHLERVKAIKNDLLVASGVADAGDLMSNPKFAELLRTQGVEPPMKISPTTGKPTYAFAKTDEEFKALADHENLVVQALVASRLGMRSTLEETRTERFLSIASRGLMPDRKSVV
jgi:DNA polymerase